MTFSSLNQWTILNEADYIPMWVDSFLIDRKVQNINDSTIKFYKSRLVEFYKFCESRAVVNVTKITASLIREYLLHLESTHHNAGGIHTYYRTIKTFLRWYEFEAEPENWDNPIKKVKPPKIPQEILDPVAIDDVRKMIKVCKNNLTGVRDSALMLFLLDSGVRASELISLDRSDVDAITGDVLIRSGKGRKFRRVFIGSRCRKALRKYLRIRKDTCPALWVTDSGEKLHYRGLKMVMRRRAEKAGVPTPSIHAYRRFFALSCLNSGMNIFSLQKLMGHSDLSVLNRYLKQTDADIRLAFEKASPVDRL
jgi:site-specific recombinase XerD